MLRHACGYKLANDGTDTRTIQAYLGHKSIQHTVRYRARAKEVADRARRAGSSFAPTSPGRNTGSSSAKPTRGKSVRESLQEAVEQARGSERY
jgi:hypothetical protein